jgi:hypothetical protein
MPPADPEAAAHSRHRLLPGLQRQHKAHALIITRVSFQGIGKVLLTDIMTCHPCRRSELAPMCPVWTPLPLAPWGRGTCPIGEGEGFFGAARGGRFVQTFERLP